ncbi:MAG: helix-turn-helix transcriptional regulator [Pyrinomonadaceae bacterium]
MGRKRRTRPKKLAGKLKAIRLDLGLTQEELAKRLDTDSGSISRYELGKREPSLLELLEYSRIAKVSLETLVDDKSKLPPTR